MRAHRVIAVITVLVIGLAAKQLFFSAKTAEADIGAASRAGMNILQMHADHPNMKNLPPQKIHDMTFVFTAP